MRNRIRWLIASALVAGVWGIGSTPADATVATGTAVVSWHAQATVKVTLTPNYFTGFGSVPAVAPGSTQPAPTHGPDATGVGLGAIDFGGVLAGTSYLYKYAAHLNVTTNDNSGFSVYGEGAADFFNTADGTTQSLAQTLFFLTSTSGSPADPNTALSPAIPFQRTSGAVTNNGQFTTPSIAYTTFPSPIAVSATSTHDYFYDYELKVPPAATNGQYFVWVVYTVVAR